MAADLSAWLHGDLAAGGPGGETGHDLARRMLGVLDEVADAHRHETVLVISHGGAMLATVSAVAPGSPERPARSDDVGECDVVVLERCDDGWRVDPGGAAAASGERA